MFIRGQRVTVFKSPEPGAFNGGYPEGFIPPVFSGTVVGQLSDVDVSAALFRALMDEYPGRAIEDLPGVRASAATHGLSFEVDLEGSEAERVLVAHPYVVVDVDGQSELSVFRPDELTLVDGGLL